MNSNFREAFKNARSCAHCNRRFKNRGERVRKRGLVGKPAVVDTINTYRRQYNDVELTEGSIVCGYCFDQFNYASSHQVFSESTDNETSQDDNEDGDFHSGQGRTSSSNEQSQMGQCESSLSLPMNDENTPAAQLTVCCCRIHAPVSEEKCVLCSISFIDNPRIIKRKLSTARILHIMLNGERSESNEPKLSGDSFICERCYVLRLRKFHSMWSNLPGVTCFQPLPHPQDEASGSQQSAYSQMQCSQESADDLEHGKPTSSDENSEMDTDDSDDDDDSSSSSDESEDSDDSSDGLGSPVRKKLAVNDNRFTLPVKSLTVSGNYCCVCGIANARCRMGKKSRLYIFRTMGLYVSRENRICKEHRDSGSASGLTPLSFIELCNQPTYAEFSFKEEQITELLEHLRGKIKWHESNSGRLSFGEDIFYTKADYLTLFGISQENFAYLHSLCKPYMRSTTARSTEDGLAIFLMKLRLNPSHRAIACFFNTSTKVVSVCINKVRKVLHEHFASKWLGFHHISRDTFINDKTSLTAKTITEASDSQAICVVDGTYLYFQKSTNYELQRKTYSLHKHRNLLKAMMVVSTRGYILAVEGPYFGDGSNNDSNIMKSMMKDKKGFRSFFEPGDYINEDRGFRDSNTLMTNLGYSVRMPHFLGKRKQHPTSEANESRLVTKIRWIVESVNGRIKNVFRFFRDVIPNDYMRKNRGFQMLEIACALLNAFHTLLFTDDEADKIIAERMLLRSELANLLQEHLENENFLRMTGQWNRINEECLADFPRMTMTELRELTFGVYQLKEARSYMADTMDEFGQYDIYFHDMLQRNAVRFKVQSRHHRGVQYDIWIGYNSLGKGPSSITGWYCKCANGSRVLGCCAHIAAIIWYLSHARYCSVIIPPGANLALSVRDARTFAYDHEFIDVLSDETDEDLEPIASTSRGIAVQSQDYVDNSDSSDEL